MNKQAVRIFRVASFLLAVAVSFGSSTAFAQRTWVSGVGDDANPCSRTAPCKTWAGAISKTAAGGEIDALDPGGYGALTITKAITLDGGGVGVVSTLVAGTNGIVVAAGTNDLVKIRNLSIDGSGSGINGIRFLSGRALYVEETSIFGFTGIGIDIEPSNGSRAFVHDVVIHDAAGGGVLLKPNGVSASVTIDGTNLDHNSFGLRVEDRGTAEMRNSMVDGNSTNGVTALSTSVAATLNVESTMIANNAAGVVSSGGPATVRLSNVDIFDNNTGILSMGGGAVLSFGNNRNAGNGTPGAPTAAVLPSQ